MIIGFLFLVEGKGWHISMSALVRGEDKVKFSLSVSNTCFLQSNGCSPNW